MEFDNPPDPDDQALAAALKTALPAGVTIDPVAAAYAAGRHVARRRTRYWQGATALSIAFCCVGWLLPEVQRDRAMTPALRPAPSVVGVDRPSSPMSAQSAFFLQQAVLERGLDGLPPAEVTSVRPVNVRELY